MDLEGIMLSEVSHTEKDNYCIIHLYMESFKRKKHTKLIEKEIRVVVTRGGGEEKGNWRKVVKRYKFPVLG